jgi:hypothetical protein
MRIPNTEYHLGSAHLCKLAALAIVQRFGEFLKQGQRVLHGDHDVLKGGILGGGAYVVNGGSILLIEEANSKDTAVSVAIQPIMVARIICEGFLTSLERR